MNLKRIIRSSISYLHHVSVLKKREESGKDKFRQYKERFLNKGLGTLQQRWKYKLAMSNYQIDKSVDMNQLQTLIIAVTCLILKNYFVF